MIGEAPSNGKKCVQLSIIDWLELSYPKYGPINVERQGPIAVDKQGLMCGQTGA